MSVEKKVIDQLDSCGERIKDNSERVKKNCEEISKLNEELSKASLELNQDLEEVRDKMEDMKEEMGVTTEDLKNQLTELSQQFHTALDNLQKNSEEFHKLMGEGKIQIPQRDFMAELKSMENTLLKSLQESNLSKKIIDRTTELFYDTIKESEKPKESPLSVSPVASSILDNISKRDELIDSIKELKETLDNVKEKNKEEQNDTCGFKK